MKLGEHVTASPCGLCRGTRRQVVATRGRGFVPLTTVICHGCGLVSHHDLPSPSEVASFYATHYRLDYKGAPEPKPKHVLRALQGATARARRLAPLLAKGAKVLDIGASSGEFAYVMGRLGFAAQGVEPNVGYAEFGRRQYGVQIWPGGLDGVEVAEGSLDLVTLNHVMEHLADPWRALRQVHAGLATQGLLFVEVPNLAGLRKQIGNTFHQAHIWNFTPETLIAVAWQAGFTPRAGERLDSTSIVFRKRTGDDAPPGGANPVLAHRLIGQMTEAQSARSYLASAAPFTRRWQRLRRNIREYLVTRRHATPREMAETLLRENGLLAL